MYSLLYENAVNLLKELIKNIQVHLIEQNANSPKQMIFWACLQEAYALFVVVVVFHISPVRGILALSWIPEEFVFWIPNTSGFEIHNETGIFIPDLWFRIFLPTELAGCRILFTWGEWCLVLWRTAHNSVTVWRCTL